MLAKQRPMVVLNRSRHRRSRASITDNARGMRRAVEHLAELGHEAITYVAGPEASWADGMRWRALREAARSSTCGCAGSGRATPTVAGGIRPRPRTVAAAADTAVIAYNDLMAIGVMQGHAARRGAGCRDDVSVVGFDNIFGSEIVDPRADHGGRAAAGHGGHRRRRT